jgi:hypothetical protein
MLADGQGRLYTRHSTPAAMISDDRTQSALLLSALENNKAARPAIVAPEISMSRPFMSSRFAIALCPLLLLPLVAHADEATDAAAAATTVEGAFQADIVASKADPIYLGVGLFSDQVNLNVETPTRWGNFMLRGGRFHNTAKGFAVNMSWRQPLTVEDEYGSGYYLGLFGGQVDDVPFAGKIEHRFGGGREMG